MRILFVGTSSNAGKTLISALFCRYLRQRMITVTPFKGFNLSGTSFITDDGREIGIGQAMQAWASDMIPNAGTSPILMKATDEGLKLFVNGRESKKRMAREEMLSVALDSYDRSCDMYDAVVAEGSGSPAEINLRDKDVANMGLASARQIPMILIGDIEKGGVFAGIYGTWLLIPEKDRHLLKGFIINKYYGEERILKSGIERIESLTGMRCMGVLPYMDVRFPEEDSSCDNASSYGDEQINGFVRSLDKMLERISDDVNMEGIMRIASE
ncbi:MAG: AAA family ATPase [Methanomassiliicoccaceae archaeon]|jgi:adenosylcobyric acid synthase|nr:AAA family ATPase [Methanomassiliicoccaceae archaeon]